MHPKSHMANLHDEFWHKCTNIEGGENPRNAAVATKYLHAQEKPGQCDTDFPDSRNNCANPEMAQSWIMSQAEDEGKVRGKAGKNHTRQTFANGSRKCPKEEGNIVKESWKKKITYLRAKMIYWPKWQANSIKSMLGPRPKGFPCINYPTREMARWGTQKSCSSLPFDIGRAIGAWQGVSWPG